MTDWQSDIANERERICLAYDRLKARFEAEGKRLSLRGAHLLLREPLSSLQKLLKLWLPNRNYNDLIPPRPTGRPTELSRLGLDDEQIEQVRLDVRGLNLDLKSDIAALRIYARSDRCPEPVSDLILKPRRSRHSIPECLRELARIPEPVRLAHEGPRALALRGAWVPRRIDVLPGDVFSSDDTTAIWAAWVPWVTSEEYPFGIKVLQLQHFPIIDVASQCVLGFALVAREKSSYRGVDLWHEVFGRTMRLVGLPRLGWQLERGTWESNLIAGETVDWGEGDGDVSLSRRVGGLRQLPTNVTKWHHSQLGEAANAFPSTLQTWTSFLPKSKSVEALINRSQTFEGTIFGSLGRDQRRRPFEKAVKLFEHCSRPKAKVDGREHFLSITEIVKRLSGIYDYLNNERMEGEVFNGLPRQKFLIATDEFPLLSLPEEQQWLYSRDWRVVRITDGWARIRLKHKITGQAYSLHYENPRIFSQLEGEKVIVYYDEQDYEQPAQVLLARTGEYLCAAHYFDRVGAFIDGEHSGHEICKAWRNAVLTAYRALVPHAPSRQFPPEIAARRAAASTFNVERSTLNVQGPELHDGRPSAASPPQPARDNSQFRRLYD